MKTKLLLLLLLFGLNIKSQNSNKTVDSLLLALPNTKNDTVKARIYINLASNLQQSNPDKALKFAFEGLEIVKKMNWKKGFSVYYNDIGNIYLNQSKHKEALAYLAKSLKYSQDFPEVRGNTLHNIAVVYFKEENIPMSLQYNDKLYELAKKENRIDYLGNCYNTYGDVFGVRKNYKKAKEFYTKALIIWKKENNLTEQATVLMNLGDISENLITKIDYYKQSKAIWDKENPSYLLAISNNMGLAEQYIKIAKNDSLYIKSGIQTPKEKLLNDASIILIDAIKQSKKSDIQQNLMFAYGKLSELEEARGNYKKALEYINLNYEIYISIFSQENKNKIATIENQKILEIKNQEIALKTKEKIRQTWYFMTGLLFLVIIGSLIFYQSQNRKKINQKLQLLNTDLDQANKAKTRFFSVLNHDLRRPVSNLIDFLYIQKESPELLDEITKTEIETTTLAAAENLLNSMEDILQWSKSQMENFKPQPKKMAIKSLFEDTKKHFSSFENIEITFENFQKLELITDENYLKTIVRNLTGNAIKALDKTKNPTIIWKAWNENNKNYLSVSDNGTGGTQDKFKALYDENEVSGIQSGLGLHLIRDLAKAINCEITINSKIDNGTTFTLRL